MPVMSAGLSEAEKLIKVTLVQSQKALILDGLSKDVEGVLILALRGDLRSLFSSEYVDVSPTERWD